MRRILKAAGIGLGIGLVIASILAAENALHIHDRPAPWTEAARAVARQAGAEWIAVHTRSADGVSLDAWLFTPNNPNGFAAILLHGVGDTRLGMMGHVRFLLQSGFTVLAPDARGHGSSGGNLITYGIREAGDVRAWADRLLQDPSVKRLYGLGESLGASVLLQSLPSEPRFRAVVAESPFSDFAQIAFDRMAQHTGLPAPLFWPIINGGFVYAHIRYGVNLRRASPADAIRHSQTPILLIHGTLDENIPIRHSRELSNANRASRLWEMAGARHVEGLTVDPAVYEKTVLDWFRSHP